jgi:hypothetical protein
MAQEFQRSLATDFRRQRNFASERALIHPPARLPIRKGPHHYCRGYAGTIEPVARVCASKLPFSRRCSASSCCVCGWPRAIRHRFLFSETVWAAARSRRWGGGLRSRKKTPTLLCHSLTLLAAVCGCESVCLHACPVAWLARRNTGYGYPSLFDFPSTLPQAVASAFSQSQ